MSLNLDKLSPEDADLARDLLNLNVDEETIKKSIGIEKFDDEDSEEGKDNLQKSVEDQIAEKEKELEDLKKSLTSSTTPANEFGKKIDEIEKSLTDQLHKVNQQVDEKVEGLGDLIKSLTDVVKDLKSSNDELKADNDKLMKSIEGSKEVIEKLASYSPGLKSAGMSGANPINRFSTPVNKDGKEVLSKSINKSDITSKLSSKMDDQEFVKSFGNDVANYEVSGRMSEKLEKAITDEFKNIELVD